MKSIELQSPLLHSILLVALVSLSIHCKDHTAKALFDKTSLQRGDERKFSLHEKLKASPYGWKILYQPSPYSPLTGYYRFLFRFLNDTKVEVAADYSSNDLVLRKSEYSILLGSTVKLSFSTACPMHYFSDSGFSPVPFFPFTGMSGSFEFLYYGENTEGDLIFRTNRSNETLLFQKATENSLNELKAGVRHLNKLVNKGKATYASFIEEKAGERIISDLQFPYEARVLEIVGIGKTETDGVLKPSPVEGYRTPYGLTPDGIFINKIKRSNGEILNNIYLKNTSSSEDEMRFETTLSDGTLLIIKNGSKSAIPVTIDFKNFMDTPSYLYFTCDDDEVISSPDFFSLMDGIRPYGFTGNFCFSRQITLHGKKVDYLAMQGTASVVDFTVFQKVIFVFDEKANKVVIKQNGYAIAQDAVKPENEVGFSKFMTILTDPEGFYIKALGRESYHDDVQEFLAELLQFTSVKYPNMEFTVYYKVE